MQKKKIVAGITAIVVLALLFAGVGYAFSGTARTYNQGDAQTLAYMSVTPSSFDAIFTDAKTEKTIFDTYVYDSSGTKTAYGFDGGEASPTTVTVDATNYRAVALNSTPLTLTVENQTGATLDAVKVTINGSNANSNVVGSTDFVYIFELQIGSEDPEYIVFNGTTTGNVNITPDGGIADNTSKAIKVTVYIGYVTNAYVPDTYIGPAVSVAATPGYSHEYRLPTTAAPADLATTAFGIVVTEYVAP